MRRRGKTYLAVLMAASVAMTASVPAASVYAGEKSERVVSESKDRAGQVFKVTAKPVEEEYDGKEYETQLEITRDATSTFTCRIQYSTDGGKTYTEESPRFKNVARDANGAVTSYNVDYIVSAENYEPIKGSTTVTIKPKPIQVSGIEAKDKTYDGTTHADLIYDKLSLSGKLSSDELTLKATGAFSDKNAGDNKIVTVSNMKLEGKDAGNYELEEDTYTTRADIYPKKLTVSWDDPDLTYDGEKKTITAKVDGVLPGDKVDLIYKGNEGTQPGDYVAEITGVGNGNYSVDTPDQKKNWSIKPANSGDNSGGNNGGGSGDNSGGNNGGGSGDSIGGNGGNSGGTSDGNSNGSGTQGEVTGVLLSPEKATLTKEGQTLKLTATVFPENAKNKNLIWSSNDPKVATADANGIVTAVANGVAVITVQTADGNKSAACTVTVQIPDHSMNYENTVPANEQKKNELKINAGLKVSQSGSTITVNWGTLGNADGYDVYVQYCGMKFSAKSLNQVTPGDVNQIVVRKVNGKKLNLKKNYKIYVIPFKMVNGKKVKLGKSITGHIVGRKNTKRTNVKAIRLQQRRIYLEVGEKTQIKGTTVLVDKKKKPLSDGHASELRFRTSNAAVATVSATGIVKAVKKGRCKVYVYARNGYAKRVSVTVE